MVQHVVSLKSPFNVWLILAEDGGS